MEINLYSIFCRRHQRRILFLLALIFLSIIYLYSKGIIAVLAASRPQAAARIDYQIAGLSKHVNMIDLYEETKDNFTCIKTKHLLHIVQTTLCLHDARDAVSNEIQQKKIWEERYLIPLLGFLIRYPQMSFIDAGANLGGYTMFAASFGRFVLSIECFKPNIDRIRKAVQIERLQDKVVLVGNAIFSQSGDYLKIKSDPFNVGSQAIVEGSNMSNTKSDTYVVKTMRFDDILPILKARNIRNAIMKVDIQWSETFLCETGHETFDYVNIPIVLMEWDVVPHYKDRVRNVLKFFIDHGYTATADMCKVLNESDALQSWPSDVFWMKLNRSDIC